MWFARGKFPISCANSLVKFSRLLLHPVRLPGRLHPRLCRREIDVEHEGKVGNAIAHCESVQLRNYLSIQLSGRTLVNSGGIEKTIRDYAEAALQRWFDDSADELTSAGFKKQQLGFGCHANPVRSKLKKLANGFADRSASRLARQERRFPNRWGDLEIAAPCLICSREEFLAGETGAVRLLVVGFYRRRCDEVDRCSKLRGAQ